MHSLSRLEYPQVLAGVVQGALQLPKVKETCGKLERAAALSTAFWLEITGFAWAVASIGLPPSIRSDTDLTGQALSVFVDSTIGSQLAPSLRPQLVTALASRAAAYQIAMEDPTPSWKVSRVFGDAVGISDLTEFMLLGSLLVPLVTFFKHSFSELQLRP